MEEINYLGEKIYRWQIGGSTFLASPQRGARLMNWNLAYPDGTIRDVIRWPEVEDVNTFPKVRGGNPILFPFCARTHADGKMHQWKSPSGEILPMPMHGIARQGHFELTRLDENGFSAELIPDAEAQKIYPFDYDFIVVYRFSEHEFNVELRLTNNGPEPLLWSAGHHFYFTIPWIDGTTRDDYELRLNAKKAYRTNADGTLLPLPKPKKSEPLSNPNLIDRIHGQLVSSHVECVCPKDGSRVAIEIGTQETPNPGYALVTWTEADDSPFFCIEPWMGPPNSPEHEIGLHKVTPGQTQTFSVSVSL